MLEDVRSKEHIYGYVYCDAVSVYEELHKPELIAQCQSVGVDLESMLSFLQFLQQLFAHFTSI